MRRRNFIKQAGLLSLGSALFTQITCSTGKRASTIMVLVRGTNLYGNIGSFSHTAGLLHILENDFPRSKIYLWKKTDNDPTDSLIKKYFPKVEIVISMRDKVGNESPEVNRAIDSSDILIQVSGAGVATNDLQSWVKRVPQKPFGIFGVTIEHVSNSLASLLNQAAFVFTRETVSLEVLHQTGIVCRNIMFTPDTTFRTNIFNDEKTVKFMKDNGLEKDKFICVIPRLRISPYWKINPSNSYSTKQIEEYTALNDQWKENDHAKMREAIIAWIRHTKQKVVLCSEMIYQPELYDELLFQPLPDEIKTYVVKHDYWFADEAMSLYSQAKAMISFECHSPIMSLICGRPAFYLRQPQDTVKGQMFRDIGLSNWVFEIEQSTGKQISDKLLTVYEEYDHALKQVDEAMNRVDKYYRKANDIISNLIING